MVIKREKLMKMLEKVSDNYQVDSMEERMENVETALTQVLMCLCYDVLDEGTVASSKYTQPLAKEDFRRV